MRSEHIIIIGTPLENDAEAHGPRNLRRSCAARSCAVPKINPRWIYYSISHELSHIQYGACR
eukprot:scaffold10319_cov50-Attheya_sp.AAC.1